MVLPEATLGLYRDHIRLLRGDTGTGVDTILSSLCARLGFVAPHEAARPGHSVLAGTEACLDRMERDAEARRSELAPESLAEGPDDAGPSF